MIQKSKLFQLCFLVLHVAEMGIHGAWWRRFSNGDFIIGALFPVTSGRKCDHLNQNGIIEAESLVFAVNMINRNKTFFGNITLGYDLRDTCQKVKIASEQAIDLVFERKREKNCTSSKIAGDKIVAVIGPSTFEAVIATSAIFSSRKKVQVRKTTQFSLN